jgi:hypothetical protein
LTQVVKSTEASGPFTGAALKALLAFLRFGLLDVEDGACLKTRERQVRPIVKPALSASHGNWPAVELPSPESAVFNVGRRMRWRSWWTP